MRIANLKGRAVLLGSDVSVDIATASEDRFGPSPQTVFENWEEFTFWAREIDVDQHPQARPVSLSDIGAPSPSPAQIFAIGLNYADHAAEANLSLPEQPLVFTKFASSIVGPDVAVHLSSDRVDWEAELVVVIGTGGRDISQDEAWSVVAGLTVGQDLSDRTVQMWGAPAAQFALGKSFAGYSPTGPAVVTLDEVQANADLGALRITCAVQDEEGGEWRTLQDGSTEDLIFSVPVLIERLSAIVQLRPGDLIFTGTPAGVGIGRTPAEFLRPGQRLRSTIGAVGEIYQRLQA